MKKALRETVLLGALMAAGMWLVNVFKPAMVEATMLGFLVVGLLTVIPLKNLGQTWLKQNPHKAGQVWLAILAAVWGWIVVGNSWPRDQYLPLPSAMIFGAYLMAVAMLWPVKDRGYYLYGAVLAIVGTALFFIWPEWHNYPSSVMLGGLLFWLMKQVVEIGAFLVKRA